MTKKTTRQLTPFEEQRRSDLLSGRASRWEVSSPRDELEKFRFFARQMEILIDQAEESEIVSLKGSIAGTNHQKAIEQFCKSRSDIRLEHGSIEIQPAFVEFLIDQLKEFIQQLESEFNALCEDTRQVEP